MMVKKLLTTTALVLAGSGAFAQGFSGAELGISYNDYPEVDDLGGISYYAAGEFALPFGISVGLDATAFDFEVGDADISNLTGHLMYAVDPSTSIGLFFGLDLVGDDENEIFGGELAYDYGLGSVEGYLGSGSDGADNDVTLFGVGATYGLQGDFGVETSIDALSRDGFSASTFEIGGFYQLPQGPKFGASLGQVNLSGGSEDDGEFFFGLQASIAVGPNGGTTFGQRGTYQILQTGVSD